MTELELEILKIWQRFDQYASDQDPFDPIFGHNAYEGVMLDDEEPKRLAEGPFKATPEQVQPLAVPPEQKKALKETLEAIAAFRVCYTCGKKHPTFTQDTKLFICEDCKRRFT